MNPRVKLKNFFKLDKRTEGTDTAVELLTKWIIPFSRGMKKASVDDVIGTFFAVDDRRFFYAKARREFKIPGKFFAAGNRPIYGLADRKVVRGQVMLIAVDRKEGTARVEIGGPDNERNFLLEKFEFETIKDWLDVIE